MMATWLFVSNFGTPFNYLYRNNGDGSFTRITTGAVATDDTNSGASGGGLTTIKYLIFRRGRLGRRRLPPPK
jgi:hypothetical protein